MSDLFRTSQSSGSFSFRLLVLGVLALGVAMGCDLFGTSDNADNSAPRPLTATEKTVVEKDNRFGLKLFRTTFQADESKTASPGNVVVSPISVSMALGMTLNGARGETREAMTKALSKRDLSLAEINDAYRGLIDLLEGLDPSVDVALANSIWYRPGLDVRQTFIDTNRVHFDAEVAALDFSQPSASNRINDWVNNETRGNIDQIVESSIPPRILMYLINATYFKGPWRTKFNPDKTTKEPFHLANGTTVSVPMMERSENVALPYLQTDQFTAVDIPYGDSLYSMTVLLPREDRSVGEVVDSLDAKTWGRVTRDMKRRTLHALKMPKFEVRYKKKLKSILRDLGMGIAFTGQANFRGIADTALAIDRVKHKTFLRVNENGTEASAATSVGMGPVSVPPSVVLDRPFVLAIRENHSGTILFMGAMMDPTAG